MEAKKCRIQNFPILLKLGGKVAKTPGLLLQAVYSGSVEVVAYLLELGLDAFGVLTADDNYEVLKCYKYPYFTLPIEVAAARGHTKVVELLLQHYNKPLPVSIPLPKLSEDFIQVASANVGTLLWNAAAVGKADLLKLLVEFGLSIEHAFVLKDAVAKVHIWRNNPLIFSKGLTFNDEKLTPLSAAVYGSHIEAVQLLLSTGADVSGLITPDNMYGPLHMASFQGCLELVELLCKKGAPVAIPNRGFLTPIDLAIQQGHLAVTQHFVTMHHVVPSAYSCYSACENGHLEVVKWLYQVYPHLFDALYDFQASRFSVHHSTVLHACAEKNQAAVVEFLLQHSAPVDVRNRKKETPLYIAALRGNIECMKVLIAYGANMTIICDPVYSK